LLIPGHTSLKVVVSGYNTRLATYEVRGSELVVSGEWDVGAENHDMTWLQLDGSTVWAGHEVGDYAGDASSVVSRWEVAPDGLALELQDYVSTQSVYTAHLLVDRDQGMAYAANYGGSSFTAIALTGTGALGEVVYLENFGQCRDASHPHQTVTYREWVWVVDLGCDTIWHYRTEQQHVSKVGQTEVKAGAGPRHMVLHPTRGLALLLCELQSWVQVYRLDESTGSLELTQELQLSSAGGDAGAEILVGPSGKFVYASSRGTGVVVVYRLEDDDTLTRVEEFNLGGSWPRSMAIKDSMLVVIDQYGDSVQVLSIDQDTGKLQGGALYPTPSQPSFVDFMG
jgi:6-phosphogluconolactonase